MALAFALVLAILALSGCGGRGGVGPPPLPGQSETSPGADPVGLEVYGDSLTVADSPSFQAGMTGPRSWAHHLPPHGMRMEAGSGRWGATAGDILAQHLRPGVQADLLVLFLGTNDLAAAGPADDAGLARRHEDFIGSLDRIVERRGYPPERVVVVAVGPRNGGAAAPVERWNSLTHRAAADRGWQLLDPWPRLRTSGNRYADPSLTTDGLHLDTAGAERLAAGMAAGIRRLATPGAGETAG
ncbi:MAG: SGNH/GDSL hydrolase family protein [Micrococcus sp.]|nr:SGNH/GDSL hydrolase family protein [Micrococcus sp.]